MNSLKSFYLELLRVFAALYVFIYHVGSETVDNKQYLSNERFVKLLNLNYATAHCFVMLFFVLSGYLITMSASKPNLSFKTFIINRLGRLYSVLIPALLFSFILAYFFKFFNYSISTNLENMSFPVLRFLLNLFFLGQASTLCSVPPLNGAFWSVQYEFVYYIILGNLLLVRKWYKYLILIVVIFIGWLKILLLFPIWLTGSFLYYFEKKASLNKYLSVLICCISTLIFVYYLFNSSKMPFQVSTNENHFFGYHLYLSWNYKADYIFAIIVFINMFSFFQLTKYFGKSLVQTKIFKLLFDKTKLLGNCSYTLYLFHTPLLFCFATIFPYNRFNNYHIAGLIFLVLTIVYFIAKSTEWKVIFWRERVNTFFCLLSKQKS